MTAKVETASMNVSNSSSWGDMLRTIDHDRKNLSWDPNQTQRVQRIGHYDVSIPFLFINSIVTNTIYILYICIVCYRLKGKKLNMI